MANQPPPQGSSPVPVPPIMSPAGEAKVPVRRSVKAKLRHGLLWLAGFVAIGIPLLVVLWAVLMLHYTYSDGERAGYVQKFSRKGWVCKTWEGELAMVSLPGTLPEVFRFTVRDAAVAQEVNRTLGQRVALRYDQHVALPTTCWGETDHFVVAVRPVAQ
jgi:hypothetical protein